MGAPSRKLNLYLRHRAALIDYAAPIVGDRARAEDVVQEAWLRFSPPAESAPGRPILRPVGYLYRVVRNIAIDFARKGSREIAGERGEALAARHEPVGDLTVEALHRAELRSVAEALAKLPERSRRAFHMRRFEGMTYAEIGEALGVSQARAHSLVAEVIAHCAERLMDRSRKN